MALSQWQVFLELLYALREESWQMSEFVRSFARKLSEAPFSSGNVENLYNGARDLETRRSKHTDASDDQVPNQIDQERNIKIRCELMCGPRHCETNCIKYGRIWVNNIINARTSSFLTATAMIIVVVVIGGSNDNFNYTSRRQKF